MMGLVRSIRSLLAVVACLVLLGLVSPFVLYLIVIPWSILDPQRGHELGVAWVTWNAHALVFLCRLGGATFKIEGAIDCAQAGVVIMNHQSLLEIAPLIHIVKGRLPRFVARTRYAAWIPTVSRAIRYLDCIIVDPKRQRAGAVLAIQRAAEQELRHVVMLFPEGHRTKDGEIAGFRPAGMVALLEKRRMPVWTIVGDGFWHFRTLKAALFGLGSVRGRLKVVEQVLSPEDVDELPAFIEARRQNMIRELASMRSEATN